ncbi:MAG: serine/threonine protein kinase, partial [Myxococcales bacterium]|nr:serine/threonine protein kinase [Myxococcales bacterium]
KPENIFLVPDEGTEVPKVLDFGVAKQTAQLDSNTRTGALLGTPYYMSPEQAQGTRAIDHRADLWSFAVVIYRCLTGQLPFQSHALGDLLIKIVTQPVPVPSQVAAGLPPQFDAWWAKASQRDPAHRFQSAKELVDALGMALGVTLPHSLGNTPMPGAEVPMAVRTVMAQPGELPPHYGDGRPPYDSQLSFDSQNPYQSHGQSHGQSQGGQTAGGLTNGSSVMGVATTAAQPAQGNKRALVAALAAILVLGGIGGFLLMGRSDAETEPPITDLASPAASEPATPSEPTAEPEETATPEADESKGDGDEPNGDDAEPATSASAAADTGKAPVPVPRAVPVPRPREVPDKPPTPTPTPKPSPKGDGYDPGF